DLPPGEHIEDFPEGQHAHETALRHHHEGADVVLGHGDHAFGQQFVRRHREQGVALDLQNLVDEHVRLQFPGPSYRSPDGWTSGRHPSVRESRISFESSSSTKGFGMKCETPAARAWARCVPEAREVSMMIGMAAVSARERKARASSSPFIRGISRSMRAIAG